MYMFSSFFRPFFFLPSLLPYFLISFLLYSISSFVSSSLSYILPSFLSSFHSPLFPSFLTHIHPSFVPCFLPFLHPSLPNHFLPPLLLYIHTYLFTSFLFSFPLSLLLFLFPSFRIYSLPPFPFFLSSLFSVFPASLIISILPVFLLSFPSSFPPLFLPSFLPTFLPSYEWCLHWAAVGELLAASGPVYVKKPEVLPHCTVVSLQALPDRLHILVAVVSYKTKLVKWRKGLCSSWLASLDPSQGQWGQLTTAASAFSVLLDSESTSVRKKKCCDKSESTDLISHSGKRKERGLKWKVLFSLSVKQHTCARELSWLYWPEFRGCKFE